MDVDEEEEEGDSAQRLRRVPDYGIEVDFELLSANEREVSDLYLSTTCCAHATALASIQNVGGGVLGDFDASITKLNAEIERMTPNMKAMDRHVFHDFLFCYHADDRCLGLVMSRTSSPRQRRMPRRPVNIPKTQEIRSVM
jgi:hypothetical protein